MHMKVVKNVPFHMLGLGLPFEIRIDIRIFKNIRKVDSNLKIIFECLQRFEYHFDMWKIFSHAYREFK